MCTINNEHGTICTLTESQYNLLTDRVDIFKLEPENVRISDIYCGSMENTKKGLDGLFKLINLEEVKNVDTLVYAIKLIDGLCIELRGEEKAHTKSQISINNLEHTCKELFDGTDFVLTKIIDKYDIPYKGVYYYDNCLYYIHSKSLYVYNFLTSETKCILKDENTLGNVKYTKFAVLNNYVYLYAYSSSKKPPAACNIYYEIDTKLHTIIALHPDSMDWLIRLYNNGESFKFTGKFPKNTNKSKQYATLVDEIN